MASDETTGHIVFASAVTDPEIFERCAEAGVRRLQQADPEVGLLVFASLGSIFRNYNLILDKVAERDDVEALVLIHQDAEIVDPDFLTKIRDALAGPEVGLVGCAGALDVRSIAWWEGSITWASFTHRYEEMGGGEIPAFSWATEKLPPFAQTGEVDSVDGFVMALPPSTVREVRFDESLGRQHGYDFDYCMQVRAAGKRIVTADLQVVHHHSLRLIQDIESWVQAHMKVAEKWDAHLPSYGSDDTNWKQRARRAEAEASAARLMGGLEQIIRVAQYKELEALRASRSWRLMAPARAVGTALRSAARRK